MIFVRPIFTDHIGTGVATLLVILLVCATDALAAPTITANPNPVLVPAGQTNGETTIAWNTEGPGGFVWMSVDGGDQTAITAAPSAKGSLAIAVTLGKSYVFKLYNASKEQLAEIKVTIAERKDEGSSGGVLNRKVTKREAETNVKVSPGVYGQKGKELRCRGGAPLRFDLNASGVVSVEFTPARLPADDAGRNLEPGQCGWRDRPMRDDEPKIVWQYTNPKQILDLSRLPRDPSVPDKDRYPNYDDLRAYLSDPKHYWSFFVRDTGRKDLWAEYSRSWHKTPPINNNSIRVTRP